MFASPKLVALALSSFITVGCAAKQDSFHPPVATATSGGAPSLPTAVERHVYRFEFVLTSGDGNAPSTTTFTLNLTEFEKGEMMVGKNVPLTTSAVTATAGSPSPPTVSPRQDVGIKVTAMFRTVGDDAVLDVTSELSSFDSPVIRKAVMRGSALATPGKSTTVSVLEDDHKRYALAVTATKLR